jgi:DNA-binding LytR/AlgR family response regulator
MNILIIEDELPAFRRLAKLIEETVPDAVINGPLETIEAARAWFANNSAPFLTFCDIHLADGSAFDLLNGRIITSPVILTTAYDQYALEAFHTDAIAYLLKPVKKETLEAAVEKALRLGSRLAQRLPPVTTPVRPDPPAYKSRFMVRFGEHLKLIMADDMAYCFTENKATFARTFDGRTYPLDQNLDMLEECLDPIRFFRLNRQFLINIKAIGEMRTYTKARVIVQLLPPAKETPVVSSERAAAFKQWLADEL